ncbi:MAG TPA: hypothetical protein VFA87_00325 [Rhizomicrobium sp.]|nr:hypothetical protein [Rhizomicrobium sp.]
MKGEILPPLTASVHVKPKAWRFGIRLWLPLFLLWLLLLPLFLLALPVLAIAAVIFGVNFLAAIGRSLAVLAGFRGTQVDVENRETRVFIKLN